MANPSNPDGLTPRQRRFALEYLKNPNATQAAIAAGYSEQSARAQGPRLLKNAALRAFLGEKATKREEKLELDAEKVLGELMRLAFCDVGQAFDEQGQLKPLHVMPEDCRRAIAGIEAEELFDGRGGERERIGTLRKVKFWSKPDTLVALGKHLKLFTDKVEATGKDGGPLEVVIRDLATEGKK